MMEDMKGKIRVYARVRPMLGFEAERGHRNALNIPDELTLDHIWKDKKREYNFDAVFPPGASQDKVCCAVCLAFPGQNRSPAQAPLQSFSKVFRPDLLLVFAEYVYRSDVCTYSAITTSACDFGAILAAGASLRAPKFWQKGKCSPMSRKGSAHAWYFCPLCACLHAEANLAQKSEGCLDTRAGV